ncbi:hypothetical protein NL676_035559 [Syzygium grande]|nr:hypothetical protein NL676_035559 [Syzygium grande]
MEASAMVIGMRQRRIEQRQSTSIAPIRKIDQTEVQSMRLEGNEHLNQRYGYDIQKVTGEGLLMMKLLERGFFFMRQRADPVHGEVVGIEDDSPLQGLGSGVGITEAGVLEGDGRVDDKALTAVTELVEAAKEVVVLGVVGGGSTGGGGEDGEGGERGEEDDEDVK